MGSEFSPSVRACLPLCALVLETAFVLIFCFFTSYNDSANNQTLTQNSQVFQDITIMAALGLGFLTSSFPKNSWSSVAFNLFILAIGVQWAVLLDGFLNKFSSGKIVIELSSIQLATMSAMSVLISVGAVLGKTNLLQLMMMALVEVTAFSVMMMVDNHTSMMHIHVFAAYFGLAVAWCLSSSQPKEKQREVKTAKGPDLFAMLGTLFLWIFWPNFNSALLSIENKRKAVFNTYYALAVSSVTATSVSAAAHPEGKISMTHIHSAVLAGGVAVGASCHLISSPWPAMLVGLLAGLISVGGAKCLPVGFHRMLMVHYAFGLPGLLGEITYITLMALQASQNQDTTNCYQIFLNMGILSFVMIMSLASGFLTGSILRLQIWKAPGVNKYYYDQDFWKFPHLADEF
ncbi:RH-like protein isoform X2 [Trichechus manatus latirostris]|uniref:RH-like protein isoform X2 n=1 Tax=Trichechus manatus latirostris TaxID=127582 RepID=A0A2Y9R7W1_TRIMA|nr:RH-like protein isoform X2 [Trichechus manatus latirostris]